MTESIALYLGIDVGGTNTKAGVVNARGESFSRVSSPTHAEKGPEAGVQTIRVTAERAVKESGRTFEEIRGVGLATPGTMDIPGGLLIDPPNLPGWQNFPIRDRVAGLFGRPTVLQNDASAAAYGEFWVGAGRHAHSLVFWTLGTGIGCGIIIGDVIVEGEHSHGSECDMIIEMDNGRLWHGQHAR
jgi:glucokinase